MKIPEVRDRLMTLAELVEDPNNPPLSRKQIADIIRLLVLEMYRRPRVRRAPDQSMPMNPALRLVLRNDALLHPLDSYHDIANRHGVTIGRVSEAVAGKRK